MAAGLLLKFMTSSFALPWNPWMFNPVQDRWDNYLDLYIGVSGKLGEVDNVGIKKFRKIQATKRLPAVILNLTVSGFLVQCSSTQPFWHLIVVKL